MLVCEQILIHENIFLIYTWQLHYLSEPRVIKKSRVSACACNDELWPEENSHLLQPIISINPVDGCVYAKELNLRFTFPKYYLGKFINVFH